MAWGKKKKKDKKVKVNVVKRPEKAAPVKPAVPAPKLVPAAAKPIGPELKPVNPIPAKTKPADIVKIHMLGNAMVGDVQYKEHVEYTVPMSTYRAIGKSCVSTARWRIMQARGGLNALHK